MLLRALPLLACAALLLPGLASAQAVATSTIETAAAALRSDPVYVDPDARSTLSEADAETLRNRIDRGGGGIYVAVLDDDGLSPEAALRQLSEELGRDGTYAVIVGRTFRAGATSGREGLIPDLANAALRANRSEGAGAILLDFVDRVDAARSGRGAEPATRGEEDGGSGLGGLGVIAVIGAALVGFFALRRRRRDATAFAEVRETAEADLIALGDDIRALDLDVEMPSADRQGKEDYGLALGAYERASQALKRARRPQDLEAVSSALEGGRFAMASAKARLAGELPPERRSPCFFDPRHGPS
ncbi:MAG: hypothetical protein H0T39_03810, partial [Actinobacteria bacterium]|nr:hypothetical protein [Actinomycetota bacterium]